MAPFVEDSLSWKSSLVSVSKAEPPPESKTNSCFTRDKYEPVKISVDGIFIASLGDPKSC
jgi:hypothetical protein